MIQALTKNLDIPIYGLMTRTLRTNADGYHEIYMFPYGAEIQIPSEACHIGDCNTRERVIHTEVFNSLGVSLLEAKKDGILVLDEIGFMESTADAFCHAVLDCLQGEIPVLAAVRTSIDTPFIRQVLSCERAEVVEMNPECFDDLYRQLYPIVRSWKQEGRTC